MTSIDYSSLVDLQRQVLLTQLYGIYYHYERLRLTPQLHLNCESRN